MKNQPTGDGSEHVLTLVSREARHPQILQSRYPGRMTLRVPSELMAAVCEVAGARFTTPSQYVRQAVLVALRADGLDLTVPRKGAP